MSALAVNPWRAAARSLITYGDVGPDHPEHVTQHPLCGVSGQHETVYTRCCRKPIALGRLMWPCEVIVELPPDCCDRPWPVFGDPR